MYILLFLCYPFRADLYLSWQTIVLSPCVLFSPVKVNNNLPRYRVRKLVALPLKTLKNLSITTMKPWRDSLPNGEVILPPRLYEKMESLLSSSKYEQLGFIPIIFSKIKSLVCCSYITIYSNIFHCEMSWRKSTTNHNQHLCCATPRETNTHQHMSYCLTYLEMNLWNHHSTTRLSGWAHSWKL